MKSLIAIVTLLVLAASPSAAQQPTPQELDEYIELVRLDVRQQRAEIMGESMRLSAGEASSFWPIYEQYETAYTTLGNAKLQLIADYADAFDTMTDEVADGLVDRLFTLTDDEQALLREYHGKVASAVGGAVAARFVQVERRIRNLLDLRLAAEIPLLVAPL